MNIEVAGIGLRPLFALSGGFFVVLKWGGTANIIRPFMYMKGRFLFVSKRRMLKDVRNYGFV